MRITFEVLSADLRTVAVLLEALVVLDTIWLHDHPDTPHLYRSGVRYTPEDGAEEWPIVPIVLARGFGDCEDLAAWLAAFYRIGGWTDAVAFPVRSTIDPRLIHCLVSRDGTAATVEDPSAVLGAPPMPLDDLARALEVSRKWLRRSCRSWELPRSL